MNFSVLTPKAHNSMRETQACEYKAGYDTLNKVASSLFWECEEVIGYNQKMRGGFQTLGYQLCMTSPSREHP